MPVPIAFLNELVDRFAAATKANIATPGRKGSVIQLGPEECEDVLVAGDLHGQRDHFNKIVRQANLDAHPKRHLVLQEVVHGGPTYPNGGCKSHMLLEDIALLKVRYPNRFHFLLCNHELSELTKIPIKKAGVSQNQIFSIGLESAYGAAAKRIAECYDEFIRSLPLAIRLRNGVFISHSIPDKRHMAAFDKGVFFRELNTGDLHEGGSAHALVWGREHDPTHVKSFADLVKATCIINGHQPAPAGYYRPNDLQLVFDASGAVCYTCLIPTNRKLTAMELEATLTRL